MKRRAKKFKSVVPVYKNKSAKSIFSRNRKHFPSFEEDFVIGGNVSYVNFMSIKVVCHNSYKYILLGIYGNE